MNAVDAFLHAADASIEGAIDTACGAIAPSWPLDRFIAVNPYWGCIDHPFQDVAAQQARLAGSRMHMPRAYYRRAWHGKALQRRHLAQVLAEAGLQHSPEEVIAALEQESETVRALPLLSELRDAQRDLSREPAWRDTITHQISQFCAAFFDTDQADWYPSKNAGLYAGWREALAHDHGMAMLMNAPEVLQRASALPADARQAIAFVLDRLAPPALCLSDFLRALLLRINGWAAWCAYLRWQARLAGGDDAHLVELLAIRLAWEYLLDDGLRGEGSTWARWQHAWWEAPHAADAAPAKAAFDADALLQRALEIAYQTPLAAQLAQAPLSAQQATPAVQAAFCIDVRSELFRRALESAAPGVQTLGCAGFFGLPISYTPLGTTAARPQLPGLLAPTLRASDSCGNEEQDRAHANTRRNSLAARKPWQAFQRLPASAFTLVETLGIGYLGKLVRRSLPATGTPQALAHDGAAVAPDLRPILQIDGADAAAQKAALAERILKAMGLTEGFARIVLFAGHGSQSANNPHAAGLDCGACCGQTGEVNARALAALMNEHALRQALAARGIRIPGTTHFLAGLHNTCTDELVLFDTALVPASHADDLAQLRHALAEAGKRARAERAPSLGLADCAAQPAALLRALQTRANDWAQTRPEWGLANNAAFIVAPRSRTRGLDLGGRAFLQEYDAQHDADGSGLELIMTAPMVVAHWINMQYFASTVDNLRYGSGNKLLHNVVGGRIGVFEGNGGDLRIGLPLQSLHDGTQWMHTPLRLSVFIEAPRAGIDAVIAKHEVVRHLVEHQWLHLFRIDPETHAVEAYANGRWQVWAQPPEQEAMQ